MYCGGLITVLYLKQNNSFYRPMENVVLYFPLPYTEILFSNTLILTKLNYLRIIIIIHLMLWYCIV